jgi:phospho-N-acetylmuramoyl-pentapeptide-transferase
MENLTHRMTDAALFSLMGFILAMLITPIYTHFAYKYKFWKRQRSSAVTGEKLQIFNKLHAKKMKRHMQKVNQLILMGLKHIIHLY